MSLVRVEEQGSAQFVLAASSSGHNRAGQACRAIYIRRLAKVIRLACTPYTCGPLTRMDLLQGEPGSRMRPVARRREQFPRRPLKATGAGGRRREGPI